MQCRIGSIIIPSIGDKRWGDCHQCRSACVIFLVTLCELCVWVVLRHGSSRLRNKRPRARKLVAKRSGLVTSSNSCPYPDAFESIGRHLVDESRRLIGIYAVPRVNRVRWDGARYHPWTAVIRILRVVINDNCHPTDSTQKMHLNERVTTIVLHWHACRGGGRNSWINRPCLWR